MLSSLLYILYIIQCWHKKISHNLEKKLIKVIQKIGKTIYLYKSVDIIIFLLHLKFYQNFKNYHAKNVNKTDLVNMFCVTLSDYVFWNLRFCFYLDIQTRWYLYFHLEKDSTPCFCVSIKYLVVWILWPELRIYFQF